MSSPTDKKQSGAGRPACTISASDLQDLLHEHMGRRIDAQTFAASDPADVHARHRNFFKALLQHTRALNKTVVTSALPGNLSAGQRDMVCAQLLTVFSDLLRKDRNSCEYKTSETYNEILGNKRARTDDAADSLADSPVEETLAQFQQLIVPAAASEAPVEICRLKKL